MGKLQQFSITFDENKDVFWAGECVKGHVVVQAAEDMKMKGLWLLFYGHSHVEWERGSGDDTITYKATETYFHHEVTLFGKARGQTGDSVVLPAGRHVFPFQYQLLAEGLPSSFEGKHGYVRYIIKGTMYRPWKFDHTTKTAFTILDKSNEVLQEGLNRTHPHDLARALTTPGCLCRSGPVELQVQPDRSVYCPGEVMVIRGNLNNDSGDDVTSVEARLVQIATFHGNYRTFLQEKTKTIDAKNIVQRVRISGCKRGQSLAFSSSNGAALRVPPLPPSSLRFCKIIDIKYQLDVVACVEGTLCSSSLKTQIPIKISPYRHHPHDSAPPPWGTPCPEHPTHPGPPPYTPGPAVINQPTAQVPSAPDLGFSFTAPPSYAESVHGLSSIRDTDDTDYTMGEMNFAPKYAYYDWSRHGQS
ncbi:hypothetical protein Bbelb_310280 [Branchiostoma belcheri]|nr:hypothetical protein Bbelb_310280 [Branchiostoma belcheri]